MGWQDRCHSLEGKTFQRGKNEYFETKKCWTRNYNSKSLTMTGMKKMKSWSWKGYWMTMKKNSWNCKTMMKGLMTTMNWMTGNLTTMKNSTGKTMNYCLRLKNCSMTKMIENSNSMN